ncbi:hypothetical protein D3C80_966320 [compost metagenome]
MPQLFLVTVEHTEHNRRRPFDQLPPAAVGRVLAPHNPALGLQRGNELGHGARCGQPLIDSALLQAAAVSMHELAVNTLAFQGCEQVILQVELADQVSCRNTQLVQAITVAHPVVERLLVVLGAELAQGLKR